MVDASREREKEILTLEQDGRAQEPAWKALEPAWKALEPTGKALEPVGKAPEPAGRPGGSWEGQLRGPGGGSGAEEKHSKRERTERSWYVVVPCVIIPYGAIAQKPQITLFLCVFLCDEGTD